LRQGTGQSAPRVAEPLHDRDRGVVVGDRRRHPVPGGRLLGIAAVPIRDGEVVAPGDRPVFAEHLAQPLQNRDRGVVVGDRRQCPVPGGRMLGAAAVQVGTGEIVLDCRIVRVVGAALTSRLKLLLLPPERAVVPGNGLAIPAAAFQFIGHGEGRRHGTRDLPARGQDIRERQADVGHDMGRALRELFRRGRLVGGVRIIARERIDRVEGEGGEAGMDGHKPSA